MSQNQEEYLTVKELSVKIKFAEQTIYNMIHKGIFVKGEHYIKPRPKKVLFMWSAIAVWLESSTDTDTDNPRQPSVQFQRANQSHINI